MKKAVLIIISLVLMLVTIQAALAASTIDDATAYWSLDTADGGLNPTDLTLNGNDGTSEGTTATDSSGQINEGIAFTANGIVNTTAINIDTWNNGFTYAFWIKTTHSSGENMVLGDSAFSLSKDGFAFRIGADGRLDFIYTNNGNKEGFKTDVTTAINDGNWHSVIASWDGSGSVNFYTDNVFSSSLSLSTGSATANSETIQLGGSPSASADFSGSLDEIGFWNYDFSAAQRSEYQAATENPYAAAPPTPNTNFSTIETSSFKFTTPISIGTSYAVVNSLTLNNTDSETSPFYYSSSFSTYGAGISDVTATCRIAIDGTPAVTSSRTISVDKYGNFKLISPPTNLTYGVHTITTECLRDGAGGANRNFVVNNSQMTEFHLYDTLTNTTANYKTLTGTGLSLTTTPSQIANFSFTTSNTTNTTNSNNLVLHGRASYNYDNTGDITTWAEIVETGEVCGNYTRGGTAGSTGSVGTTCLFRELESNTTYTIGFYGYTSTGTGSVDDLLINSYDLSLNNTAANTISLSKTLSAGTLTEIARINISNHLGGTFNVFVDSGIIVSDSTEQEAYFFINNTENSINYYRTINSDSGNVNGQAVFSESGTGSADYTLYGYCPSGCEVTGGHLTAFVSDAEEVSTGTFSITAFNSYNSSSINVFNATIGGATLTTTNGTITAIGQGTTNVLIEAQDFFSNTTSHDTTTNLNAGLKKYTEVRAYNYGGGSILTYGLNTSTNTYNTTTGIIYIPITANDTAVTFDSPVNSYYTDFLDPVQYFNFTAYAENSLLLTFKDSVSDNLVSNVSLDYWSSLDSSSTSTNNGTLYLTLLNPVSYTFRINSSGYENNLFFTTITDDTFASFTIYLNPNTSTTPITIEVVDGGASPVSNAIVKALKFYVSDNTYRVVASGVTNTEGDSILNIETGDNFYKFVVVLDDEVVKTTTPSIITGSTIRIQVLTEEDILADYKEVQSITRSLVFNSVTNNFRFDFTDKNSVNREICLYTYRSGVLSDTLEDVSCVSGTSGTILTGVTNTTGKTYYAKAVTTIGGLPTIIAQETYSFRSGDIGASGLVMQIFLTLILSLSGFVAIELLLILAPLSLIIGGVAHLHTLPLSMTAPLLVIGIITMFILRRNN